MYVMPAIQPRRETKAQTEGRQRLEVEGEWNHHPLPVYRDSEDGQNMADGAEMSGNYQISILV